VSSGSKTVTRPHNLAFGRRYTFVMHEYTRGASREQRSYNATATADSPLRTEG